MRITKTFGSAVLALALLSGSAMAQGYDYGRGGMRYEDRRGPPMDEGYGRRGYGGGRGGQICAEEHGFCSFRGFANVRYGARGRYVVRQARDGIPCNNRVFRDPTPGVPKACFIN